MCGLCGNYDGNSKNDFTTRSGENVVDTLDFGNSWKVSGTCPDAELASDPCSANPYREAWSKKQCSIINSITFKNCHSKVKHFNNTAPSKTHNSRTTNGHNFVTEG